MASTSPFLASAIVRRCLRHKDATVHGFRSAFRDWAAERTNFANEVCEAALAHVIENKAEAAYRRGDLFEKRRKLMEAWATFCSTPDRAVQRQANDPLSHRSEGSETE